jgi:hypothetical protein
MKVPEKQGLRERAFSGDFLEDDQEEDGETGRKVEEERINDEETGQER